MISVETTSVPRRILDKTESRYSINTFHSNFSLMLVSLPKFLIRTFESAYELHVKGPRDIIQPLVSNKLSTTDSRTKHNVSEKCLFKQMN